MTIKANFPSIRPSLNLDFANSKVLDPRITFSRASTATYYDGKTTVKAEENLLTYSQGFDNSAWTKSNATVTANAITAPDGTMTADESKAQSVLYTVTPEVLDEDGNVTQEAQTQPNYRNIDVLGVLFDTADPENPVAIPGWHVNVRVLADEDAAPLQAYSIVPTNPHRVWA